MRFLIDRCAGTVIGAWLRTQGHDVVESRERGIDPGDRVLLEWAAQESRILITIDTDFGQLVFREGQAHAGLIRLPDVPSKERVAIIKDLTERFQTELESHAIITVRGGKIRISASPERSPK
jgi:predicted nuclease of predicted toxin-antitoxin system